MITSPAGRIGRPAYIAGLLLPYLTVGFGLHVFHSAWAAILGYHIGILVLLRLAKVSITRPFGGVNKPLGGL